MTTPETTDRLWPPPYWFAWFLVAVLVSFLIDALVVGQTGEWFGGVFFGVGVMVVVTKPGPSQSDDARPRSCPECGGVTCDGCGSAWHDKAPST